jgi:hypothetical protein
MYKISLEPIQARILYRVCMKQTVDSGQHFSIQVLYKFYAGSRASQFPDEA